jgi:Electron transfer flavoprotein, alpha subunit
LGYNIESEAQKLINYGADSVIIVDDVCLERYSTEPYAQAVAELVWKREPDILLFPATSIGRDLAPRLSARLHTGLTADCTKLETDKDGNLFMTRPAFGGNLLLQLFVLILVRKCRQYVRVLCVNVS